MKTKKIFSLILVSIATLSLLAGCSSNANSSQEDSTTKTTQNSTENETEEAATGNNTTKSNEKTLVVYYSASGNTKDVADIIAKSTNGDIFELVPKEPYTDDDLNYSDDNSRVSREHDNESERNVELTSTTVKNWDSYDTIFIGYPIWWGIAAWPVDGFIKANDFKGKTVIPFCTSSTSGLGESGKLLEKMSGTGDWKDGRRFESGVSEADVQAWINELDISK